jgi:ABC-type Fe3+-hydroxamate transport system substrate-binding protein
MKTKTKTLAVVEIAIVLCSIFFLALPAIATEQTMQKVSASTVTAASEIYDPLGLLDIFGNANEDDTIDMRDTTYIKLVIFGKKPETDLADANYDGKVSMLDVGQTKLIILGKEKELTILEDPQWADPTRRVVTIKKPVKRVVVRGIAEAETLRLLNAADTIVGVGDSIKTEKAFGEVYFPELSKLPSVGSRRYCSLSEDKPSTRFSYIRTSEIIGICLR